MRESRRILRKTAIVSGAAAAVLFLFWFGLSAAARVYLSNWLSRELSAPAAAGSVRIDPFRARLLFRDFTLEQPPGFGAGPALRVESGSLRVDASSIFSSRLIFEEIDLQGVEIRLARDPAGKFNTSVFFPSSPGPPAGGEETSSTVLIRSGSARGIACSYTAGPAPGGAAAIGLREGELEVRELLFARGPAPSEPPGRVILTGRIEQREGSAAFLGLAGRIDRIGSDIPRLRAALRVYGLETDTLAGFFPPPGPRIVGEDAFDLAAGLRLSPEELEIWLTLVDWTGQAEGIEVRGRPDRPEVELSAGFSLFLRHHGYRAGEWLERYTGRTGGRVVNTSVSTLAAAGEGVIHLASSLGKGIFGFGRGIWRGDAGKAARGVSEAGTGAARGAVKTVVGPGTALADGTGFRRAARGRGAADAWRYETGTRWTRDWEKSCSEVFADPPDDPDFFRE